MIKDKQVIMMNLMNHSAFDLFLETNSNTVQ